MVGHTIDENTYALWTFNSGSVYLTSSYIYANDATGRGSFALTQSTEADRPLIIAGPDKIDGQYARWFDGTTHHMEVPLNLGTNAADLSSVLTGSFTLEAWIKPWSFSGFSTIFNAGGTGEDTTNDYLIWWRINGSGEQDVFWENGGTNYQVTQGAGATITTDEWQHIAIAVEAAAGTRTVSFYRNGVFLDDGTGVNPTGDLSDTDSGLSVGEERNNGADNYRGAIGDIRLSDIERSSAEILASYNASPRQHEVDANTFLHYSFNEQPFVIDEVNNLHMGLNSSFDLPQFSSIDLVNDGGQSLQFDLADEPVLRHPPDTDLVAVMTGSWTLEFWYLTIHGGVRWIMGYTGGSAETVVENTIGEIYYDSAEQLQVIWENGTGVNVITGSDTPTFLIENAIPTHLGLVKDVSEIDGTVQMLTYINGELVETFGPIDNCEGGTELNDNGMYFYIMGRENNGFLGMADDVRFSNIARSASEIQDSHISGSIIAVSEQEQEVITNFISGSGVLNLNRLKRIYPSAKRGKRTVYLTDPE